jgi:hypothetical protein
MPARSRRSAVTPGRAKGRTTKPKAKPKRKPKVKSKTKPKAKPKNKPKPKTKSKTKPKTKPKPKTRAKTKARPKAKTKGKLARRHRKVQLADYTAAEEQPLLWDPRTWEHAEQVLGRKRIRLILEPASEPIETGLAERPTSAPARPKTAVKPPARARVSTKKRVKSKRR